MIALATVLALGLAPPAADAILAVPRQRIQQADYRATGQLVHVDANGTRTSYNVTLKAHWFPGILRVMLEIVSPTTARERVLLKMRPGGRNAILIAHPGDAAPAQLPFEKWSDGPLGAGFSYEDLLESQYFWPGQTVLEPAKFGARDCDVILSKPGPADRTPYSQIETWLDKSIGFPVYVEKSIKDSGVVKQFTYYGLRQAGGVWSASQIEVKLRGQPGSTLLIVKSGSARANLKLKDFSPDALVHFQDGP